MEDLSNVSLKHTKEILADIIQKERKYDTHAIPPQAICNVYKKYQKMSDTFVDQDLDVVDFRRGLTASQKERIFPADVVPSELIQEARLALKYSGQDVGGKGVEAGEILEACTIYEHKDFPGEPSYN